MYFDCCFWCWCWCCCILISISFHTKINVKMPVLWCSMLFQALKRERGGEREQFLVCLDRLQNYQFNLSDLLGIVSVVTLGLTFPFVPFFSGWTHKIEASFFLFDSANEIIAMQLILRHQIRWRRNLAKVKTARTINKIPEMVFSELNGWTNEWEKKLMLFSCFMVICLRWICAFCMCLQTTKKGACKNVTALFLQQ